jgi:ribonuclease VapC
VPFDTDHALAASSFRKPTRHLDVSFADRACLATAALAKVPVLTGDRDWSKVDLGIKVILIR